MAPPMLVHSSIAVLITRLLWPNLFQFDGRSKFLFFRITKNCFLQILCCCTAWEFTFQTPVFSFRFTGFLESQDFLDLSVLAQIFATNNRFCSLEHRYRRKNWCREITEFCVVKTSFESFFKIAQDHRFFQILRSSNHCQWVQTTALFSPQGCLQSLCLFCSETHFSITEWSQFTEPQGD